MSRKRMIDPAIWSDEGFVELSITAKLLFIGLISHADDEGRGVGSPKTIKALVFPADDIRAEEVASALRECTKYMRVSVYQVDGRDYYQLENWTNHQRVDRPSPSRIPEQVPEHSASPPRALDEPSPSPRPELGERKELNNTPLPPQGADVGCVSEPPEVSSETKAVPTDAALDRFVLAWNGAKLPEYRRTPASFLTFPNAGAVAENLRFYRPDEVLAAIANYAQVVHNRGNFTYGASFSTVGNFLEKGIAVFLPGAFEGLRKAGGPGASGPSPPKPKLVCSHCGEPKGVKDFCLNAHCPAMTTGVPYQFVPASEFRQREA